MPERFVCTFLQKGTIEILFLSFPFLSFPFLYCCVTRLRWAMRWAIGPLNVFLTMCKQAIIFQLVDL